MHHQKSWIVALALASIVSAGPFFRIAPPHDHKQSKREVLKRQQPSPDETCGIAGAGAGNGYSCGINNVGFCCSQHVRSGFKTHSKANVPEGLVRRLRRPLWRGMSIRVWSLFRRCRERRHDMRASFWEQTLSGGILLLTIWYNLSIDTS